MIHVVLIFYKLTWLFQVNKSHFFLINKKIYILIKRILIHLEVLSKFAEVPIGGSLAPC